MTVKNFEQRLAETSEQLVDLVAGQVDFDDPDERGFGFTLLMQAAGIWAERCGWTPEQAEDLFRAWGAELRIELARRQERPS